MPPVARLALTAMLLIAAAERGAHAETVHLGGYGYYLDAPGYGWKSWTTDNGEDVIQLASADLKIRFRSESEPADDTCGVLTTLAGSIVRTGHGTTAYPAWMPSGWDPRAVPVWDGAHFCLPSSTGGATVYASVFHDNQPTMVVDDALGTTVAPILAGFRDAQLGLGQAAPATTSYDAGYDAGYGSAPTYTPYVPSSYAPSRRTRLDGTNLTMGLGALTIIDGPAYSGSTQMSATLDLAPRHRRGPAAMVETGQVTVGMAGSELIGDVHVAAGFGTIGARTQIALMAAAGADRMATVATPQATAISLDDGVYVGGKGLVRLAVSSTTAIEATGMALARSGDDELRVGVAVVSVAIAPLRLLLGVDHHRHGDRVKYTGIAFGVGF